jgi:UDP-3-O-[3-hydroxymyristoyl] glucosamine N-acyltransferase
MKKYSINDLSFLGNYKLIGDPGNKVFTNVRPIDQAEGDSLVWIKPSKANRQELVESTKAKIIISDDSIDFSTTPLAEKCFIVVSDPRLAYLRIVEKLFSSKPEYGVHQTACIHPDAVVHPKTAIGPFTYIGKSTIGEGTVIFGHVHIYDNVTIGKDVIIHAGTVIGADGFGYQRNEAGELEKFPHIGGVLIEDGVEIGSNTCVDKGVLGNTHIKTGAKIDNLVHIAHNVVVGKHSAVIAHAMIGGSTVIGDYSWVAPSAALLNGIKIGDKVTVGMSAVVTKNIPDGETWTGLPARPLDEFVKLQSKLKKL